MPSFCAVVNCNDRYGHSENISFHKFPLKRQELLIQWEAFIQKQRGPGWHASRWSSLCSRHFREEDFRSHNERKTLKKTAVPSVLEDANQTKALPAVGKEGSDSLKDKEFKEILAIKEHLEDVASTPKTNCRLCGVCAVPVVTFGPNNYELYALLQKCFPTLNIEQEDALPKVLCSTCHKSLQQFGEFVDIVWTAQAELQKKYKSSRAVEKPALKIKQEPLAVRVKQEVAEVGFEQQQQQDHHNSTGVAANDEYDVMAEGNHEEGDDSVDQKYEFCDFPINDCDIMEIINLDDPFINIPDDDNTTVVNETENIQKTINESASNQHNHLPTAHELLQAHMLMDEHNYAYADTEDFKKERQVYKTEKSDNDERLIQTGSSPVPAANGCIINEQSNALYRTAEPITSSPFENRALKPIVTSVSAIQQPSKANGIVVLNESIVKSVGGCHLHTCMVCHLKFFSVESLKEHYTQTHGTPMVTVPASNIIFERNPPESKCNMKKEIIENIEIFSAKQPTLIMPTQNVIESSEPFNMGAVEAASMLSYTKSCSKRALERPRRNVLRKDKRTAAASMSRQRYHKARKAVAKNRNTAISLNTMASQYQQLRKLCQTLQEKCLNLEQNVEQLQLQPTTVKLQDRTPLKSPMKQPRNNELGVETTKQHSTVPITLKTADKPPVSFACSICSKVFPNANSLRQHSITHTQERKHLCSLCQRSFKRRNGLLQHMKGFHLQVKPFACPVCNHSYALKCDMLRCKHSSLKSSRSIQ
uniref:THAP-type domain-containing protein n=1 Tax=Stomoxys calcitrans TaxID=35570 RepID=A0A1I8NUQ7_STOCA|nr:unnamed protein product [Stomoxys calcitrans]